MAKAKKVSEHFSEGELACRCCGLYNITPEALALLELIRVKLDRPIFVSSGSRCKPRNELEGGSKNSMHLKGMAFDIVTKNGKEKIEVIKAAMECGVLGLGVGSSFIHVDARKTCAVWTY